MQREYPFIGYLSCENDNDMYDFTIIKINQNSEPIELKEENKEEKVCPYYLLEGDRYDSDYENTHVIKAEKGMSCFLGHYTNTPEDKNYEYITSGQMKRDQEAQIRIQEINEEIQLNKHGRMAAQICFTVVAAEFFIGTVVTAMCVIYPPAMIATLPLIAKTELLVMYGCIAIISGYFVNMTCEMIFEKDENIDTLNKEKANLEIQLQKKPISQGGI